MKNNKLILDANGILSDETKQWIKDTLDVAGIKRDVAKHVRNPNGLVFHFKKTKTES